MYGRRSESGVCEGRCHVLPRWRAARTEQFTAGAPLNTVRCTVIIIITRTLTLYILFPSPHHTTALPPPPPQLTFRAPFPHTKHKHGPLRLLLPNLPNSATMIVFIGTSLPQYQQALLSWHLLLLPYPIIIPSSCQTSSQKKNTVTQQQQ